MGYPCDCNRTLKDEYGNLISNPDVAGIGVLIGLTVPALATFVLLLVYYFSAVDPDHLDMWTKLDISFLTWLHAKRPQWRTNRDALERIIVSFSDAQLVNALSLLLGAFTMACSMDVYHWQIMVQCVWFTSATHLATIPILRAQLYRDSLGLDVSRVSIYARATLMTIVLVMLVSSLVPTGNPEWLWTWYDIPALCFFDYNFPYGQGHWSERMTAFSGLWLSWSIGLATITFLKRLFELVKSPEKQKIRSNQPTWRDNVRIRNNFADEHIRRYPILFFFWHSSHETVWATWRLLESFGGHIFSLFMMLSWNIYLVIYNKWSFQYDALDDGDNQWGFGQTTPLVLLALPAITIIEEVFTKRHRSEEGWPTANSQLSQPVNGKMHDGSTRITVFLMFEVLLVFSLLAWLNFVDTVTEAVLESGTAFFVPFLVCLLAAPLVFTHIIHLADKAFKAMRLRKNNWRSGIIAVIVALSIGAAICFFFLHEYRDLHSEY